jgi:hypothetical protein
VAIKQKRQNYGINEFVLSAFDYDGNVVGRFVDQQTGNLALRHHSCPNGASVRIEIHTKEMNIFFLFEIVSRLSMLIKLKVVVIEKFL